MASSLGQVVPKGRLIAAPGYSAFCGCFKSKPHRSPATPHLIFIFILVDHSFQKNSEHCWLASQEGNSTKTAVHICTKKTEVWWIHFGYFWIHHGGRQTSSMAAKDTFVPRSDDQSHGKISSFHGFRGDDPRSVLFDAFFLKVLVYTHKENSNLEKRFGCLVATSSPMSAKSHNTHEMALVRSE